MRSNRRRQAVVVVAIGALLAFSSVPPTRIAAGSIKFKELKVALSHAHHRPMAPVIVVHRIDGEWRPSALPVQLELSSTYLLYLIGFGFASLRLEVNDLPDSVLGENVVVYSMAAGRAPRARRSEHTVYVA